MGDVQAEAEKGNLNMTFLAKETLPRRITPSTAAEFVGESAYWFCPTCRKWCTSSITEDGIACSVCGSTPSWEKHPPTLSYRSRFKRVTELCAESSEWRKSYDEAEQQFGDFIDDKHAGLLPPRAKESGRRYFHGVWREVDKLADFLLTAQDAPATDAPHAYTEQGLQRRYYDPRRKHNVASLSDLNLQPEFDDSGTRYTDEEIAELISLRASHMSGRPRKGVAAERYEQLCDKYFQHEFLESIGDPLERNIARDFSEGATKRDVEHKYKLSERQVRTKVAHIAKALKNL